MTIIVMVLDLHHYKFNYLQMEKKLKMLPFITVFHAVENSSTAVCGFDELDPIFKVRILSIAFAQALKASIPIFMRASAAPSRISI